jgi:hypothetical protein
LNQNLAGAHRVISGGGEPEPLRQHALHIERLHPGGPGPCRQQDASAPRSRLAASLAAQLERGRALERTLGRIVPFVFAHTTDGPLNPKTGQRRYVAGDRVKDFRRAWRTACKTAGCPGMLRHDFRRTAVRNLVNDGTPEKVAMTITGHKTRSVFDRYHIVAPEDLRAAAARIAARKATAGRRPQQAR